MKTFSVCVEKTMYCTGAIKVKAKNSDEAINWIQEVIDKGLLQSATVKWNDPQYEDCSFKTTGDVE